MKNVPLNPPRTIEDYFVPPDIHDVRREEQSGIPTLLVSFVALLLEILLIYGVLNNHLSLGLGLIMHAAIIVLLALYARMLLASHEGRFALLVLIAVATCGPFGAAGVMLTILTSLWCSLSASSFAEWFASIFPRRPQSVSERIYDDIRLGRDESSQAYNVISFLDVLSFGNSAQKRQALALMTASFHPNFAPAFHKALSDHDNMIRVQAATGITKVEALFLDRLMKLAELKSRHDKDPLVTLALAEHYDNYAYTGLLDFDREQTNRSKALEHYREYLEMQPDDVLARTRIGRILMRDKDYGKACDWFRQCMELGYMSDTISQWYSEALFELGRYDDLRRYSLSQPGVAGQVASVNPALKEALALWAGSKI